MLDEHVIAHLAITREAKVFFTKSRTGYLVAQAFELTALMSLGNHSGQCPMSSLDGDGNPVVFHPPECKSNPLFDLKNSKQCHTDTDNQ